MSNWRVKKDEIQCSLVGEAKVVLSIRVQQKIRLLLEEYPSKEWMGYLVGERKKSSLIVNDLIIPPHAEASGSSAEAEPFHAPKETIGAIHSHHSMGAFHSQTDQNHVDRNYPCSITVARNGSGVNYDAVAHTKTPCGKSTHNKATVVLLAVRPDFDAKKFLEEAKENIDKGDKKVKVHYGYQFPFNRGYYTSDFDMGDERYFARPDGTIITKRELDDHMKEIWGETP